MGRDCNFKIAEEINFESKPTTQLSREVSSVSVMINIDFALKSVLIQFFDAFSRNIQRI